MSEAAMRKVDRPDPAVAPPPVDDYLATIVTIHAVSGDVVVTPDDHALVPPPEVVLGAEVVHLITAANPYSMDFDESENEERNQQAEARLEELDVAHVPSVGRDAGATWAEPGFALFDADDDVVMALADEWCQHGIYRWDEHGWWLVLTDGSEPTNYPVLVTRH